MSVTTYCLGVRSCSQELQRRLYIQAEKEAFLNRLNSNVPLPTPMRLSPHYPEHFSPLGTLSGPPPDVRSLTILEDIEYFRGQ